MAQHPSIASVFAEHTHGLAINGELVKRIHLYERAFCNANDDHLEFFGGQLMGVHPIRFKPTDRDRWFSDVLEIDELDIKDGIASVPTVKAEWKRASDAMNLSIVWLLHALWQSDLPAPLKHQGMIDTLLILQYKFLCSLMYHFYPYPADRGTMEAAYAAMSRRYALKQAGSWNKLLRIRAEEIISNTGVHKNAYRKFNDDQATINMVSDIQGRLKKIVKTMTELFYQMRATGKRVGTDSLTLINDGQAFANESSKKWPSYIRYAHQILDDPRSFIKPELINLVADLQHTVDPRRLEEALDWMSLNHRESFPHWQPRTQRPYIEEFVDEVLLYAFELMTKQKHLIVKNEVGPVLAQLRTLYMASRMVDPSLIKAKDMADRIVEASVKSRNPSMLASVRTSIQLYLVLRVLALSHYAN